MNETLEDLTEDPAVEDEDSDDRTSRAEADEEPGCTVEGGLARL
jgi:hypothetical protein